jgi:hypothetical protein
MNTLWRSSTNNQGKPIRVKLQSSRLFELAIEPTWTRSQSWRVRLLPGPKAPQLRFATAHLRDGSSLRCVMDNAASDTITLRFDNDGQLDADAFLECRTDSGNTQLVQFNVTPRRYKAAESVLVALDPEKADGLQDSTVDGLSDLKVVCVIGEQLKAGSASYVLRGSGGREISFDLNEVNSCSPAFISSTAYGAERRRYCAYAMARFGQVEDAITSVRLNVGEQLLKINVEPGATSTAL